MGFNKGESVFFAFKDGKTVEDSQMKPRMYKTIEQAKKTYPGGFRGDVELVEYAPVVHCRDCKYWKRADGAWSDGRKFDHGACRRFIYADGGDGLQTSGGYFCCSGDRRGKK